jgi:hypothetical protein
MLHCDWSKGVSRITISEYQVNVLFLTVEKQGRTREGVIVCF